MSIIVKRVVINSEARQELDRPIGIALTLIPNVLDFKLVISHEAGDV